MNMHPTFTDIRSFTLYEFSMLRMRALRDLVWAKLSGRHSGLAEFPKHEQRNNPNKSLLGTMNIPIEQIIGTFNRASDFDDQFRPLDKHLSDRWVNTYINLERDGWAPILVHKIGEDYYVEDGHHRVSVARSIGMAFIEANVWEYPVRARQNDICQSECSARRSSSKTYNRRGLESQSVEG